MMMCGRFHTRTDGGRYEWAVWLLMIGWLAGTTACRRSEEAVPPEWMTVSVALSTDDITIGDVVYLRTSATVPPDTRIEWPRWEPEPDALVVRDPRAETRVALREGWRIERVYPLTAFHTGEYAITIPSARFFEGTDDESVERTAPAVTLRVRSSLEGAEAEFQPIRDLLWWPDRVPRWVWALASVVVLAGLLGWLTRWLLRRSRTAKPAPPPPPAHEVALAALQALLEKRWMEAGLAARFYQELSAIVRHYLEDRFSLRAPELTTEEFIREATSARVLAPAQQESVGRFLEQSDLVKFARHHPGALEMRSAFEAAQRLVLETRPPPAAEERTKGEGGAAS